MKKIYKYYILAIITFALVCFIGLGLGKFGSNVAIIILAVIAIGAFLNERILREQHYTLIDLLKKKKIISDLEERYGITKEEFNKEVEEIKEDKK